MRRELSRREFAKLLGLTTVATAGAGSAPAGRATQTTEVGDGSYATTVPSDATPPPSPAYTADTLSAPYPTNDWWSRLLTVAHAERLYSHPIVTEPSESGLAVGYPDEWEVGDGTGVDMSQSSVTTEMGMGETVYMPFDADFTVGHTATDGFDASVVEDYGDWHVSYRMGQSDPSVTVTQAKGSPYLYLDYAGGGATLTFDESPTVFAARGNTLGITTGGHHYGLFAPAGTSWTGTDTATLSNDLGGDGYLTLAVLPDDDQSTLDTFADHAHTVLTGTEIDWEYVETEEGEVVSEVRTTFDFTVEDRTDSGGTDTITALYPHQHKYLHDGTTEDGLTYASSRGTMETLVGSSFTTALPYPGIIPNYPVLDSADAATVDRYARTMSTPDTASPQFDGSLAAEYDVPTLSESSVDTSRLAYDPGKEAPLGSSYWTGVNFNRWSEAAALLDELGETDRRDLVLDVMRGHYEAWFDGEGDADHFFYDETWGTLVGHVGGFGTYEQLNDHHFHYGYFVQGASEIARHDPDWAETDRYGAMVQLLVREYANPSRDDDMFPFLRNFSPYAGHSYASGTNPFQLGNNQESSSEAINAYAGLIRWGAFTDQQVDGHAIEELGICLYTHEAHAALEYWYDWDDETHPDDWDREYAGVLWDGGYAHGTWWTEADEDTYAINVLPATGGSMYLGWDQARTGTVYDELTDLTGSSFTRWPGVLFEFRGFSDPSDALSLFEDASYTPDISDSKLHTYTMLTALSELGSPRRDVRSDATFSHVFTDDSGENRYVAYNPEDTTQTVTFSDGTQFDVAADTLTVYPDTASGPLSGLPSLSRSEMTGLLAAAGGVTVAAGIGGYLYERSEEG